MNFSQQSQIERRVELSAEIAKQRRELARAYQALERPIHYAEYGLRGFGFLRKNPWVLTVVPAALSISSTAFGFIKTLREPQGKKSAARLFQSIGRSRIEKEEKTPKSLLGHAVKWAGPGMK